MELLKTNYKTLLFRKFNFDSGDSKKRFCNSTFDLMNLNELNAGDLPNTLKEPLNKINSLDNDLNADSDYSNFAERIGENKTKKTILKKKKKKSYRNFKISFKIEV